MHEFPTVFSLHPDRCKQAAAAAASSTALAEALLSKTRRGGNGSGSGSGSGRGTPTEEGSGKRLHPSSWTETRDSVNTSVGLADSYTEMILVRGHHCRRQLVLLPACVEERCRRIDAAPAVHRLTAPLLRPACPSLLLINHSFSMRMPCPACPDHVIILASLLIAMSALRQDLVKNLTSGQSAAPDVERHFLDDLVKEMSTFRVAFEQLMGLLATFKSAEASALLDAALKKMDAMNATMALYEDVRTLPVGIIQGPIVLQGSSPLDRIVTDRAPCEYLTNADYKVK